MPIYANDTGGKDFEPAPAGVHNAVCCDVVDMGDVETQWGVKHKVRLYWQIDQERDDGSPYLITRKYTLSLHEKAALRQDLESWANRQLTKSDMPFDLEQLVGKCCQLQIMQKRGDDGAIYSLVKNIMPPTRKIEVRDYTRKKDRTEGTQPAAAPSEPSGFDDVPPPDDEDAPPEPEEMEVF